MLRSPILAGVGSPSLDRQGNLCTFCTGYICTRTCCKSLISEVRSSSRQGQPLALRQNRFNKGVACKGAVEAYCQPHADGSAEHHDCTDALHQQPSEEFLALCRNQLSLLSRLLSPEGGDVRSAVYARTASSLESGNLHLVSVAQNGPAAPYAAGRAAAERMDEGLLVLGASSSGCVSDAVAEERLVSEEVITLPDTGAVVLPLAHRKRLLGLMVVERGHTLRPGTRTSGVESDLHGKWLTVNDHQGTVDVSMDEDGPCMAAAQVVSSGNVVLYSCFRPMFNQTDTDSMKQVAATLSQACALDQRATLESTRHYARRKQVKGLIDEVDGPLRTLRTLGAMLLPRLEQGDQGRDMAQGMVVQSDRLQAVVNQLQAALHPWAHPPLTRPPPPTPLSPSPPAAVPLGPQTRKLTRGHSLLMVPQPQPSIGNVQQPEIVESMSGSICLPSPPDLPSSPDLPDLPHTTQHTEGSSSSSTGPGGEPLTTTENTLTRHPSPEPESSASQSQRGAEGSSATGECNISEILMQLVRTASQMAGLMGVVLHVSPPLRSQLMAQSDSSSSSSSGAIGEQQLTLRRPARPPIAAVPAEVLFESMRHLLDGALQRTPRGGVVRVGAGFDGGSNGIVISLSDNGVSMAHRLAAQLRRAVAKPADDEECDATVITSCTAHRAAALAAQENREDAANAMQKLSEGLPVGSGMVGLAIAQKLVEQVGGRITVKYPSNEDTDAVTNTSSSSDGRGVVVELWLPQKQWM